VTAEPAAIGSRAAPAGLLTRLSPKHLIAFLISLIIVVGEVRFGVLGGYDRLAVSLGASMVFEVLFARWLLGRWPPTLLSAYITGNSLALLLKPQEGLLWPFVLGAALSIGSKYVLRLGRGHLWNPSNFGICVLLLLAAPKVAILSHEWGNAWGTNLIIWAIGLVVVSRARLLHVTLTYAAAFLAFAWGRALLLGIPFLTEAAPLTGPMYQLLAFFMITDPPTTVSTKGRRIAVAILIALAECGLRLGNDVGYGWAAPFAPAPALFALFLVGPAVLVIERRLFPAPARS